MQQQPPASRDRHSKICARAGHLQSQLMRHLLPQGTMLREPSPWLCWHMGPTVAGCSSRCTGARRQLRSAPRLTARRADGLAGGQGSSAKDSHGFLLVPRHSARLTSIPTRHGPSAGRLCPAAAQAGDRQDMNPPCPCLCCTAANSSTPNRLQHPQTGSSRHLGARPQPFNSTRDAMQPHRADSSSWVASPVIDVLSTAQQLSWFRVNCA